VPGKAPRNCAQAYLDNEFAPRLFDSRGHLLRVTG
jgi:hypothetical protein